MLVVVALTVLLMSIIAEVFALASETMSRLRALSTVNEKIRTVERLLRMDLENRSVRSVQPPVERKAGEDGIFGTVDDWFMPVGIDPRSNLGYFMIIDNSPADEQGEDTDDILQLTCRVAHAGRPDLAAVGIGYEGKVVVGSEPDLVDGVADGRARSLEAEVIWFLRKGTLYRRVLLVGLPQPSSLPAGQSWYYNYDISARPPISAGAVPIVNTLGDLSYRSTRYGHQPPSNYTGTDNTTTPPLLPGLDHDYPGDPLFRSTGYSAGLLEFEDSQSSTNPGFAYHSATTGSDQLDHNYNYPFAPSLSPLSLPERWFGRPTLRETSSPNWNYPTDPTSQLWNTTGGFTDASSTLYYQVLNSTALRPAEDAVLTNVLSVDMKVWDPDAISTPPFSYGGGPPTGAYVDLGKMCLNPSNSPTATPSYLAPGAYPSSGTSYGLPGADPNASSGYGGFASTYPKPSLWPPDRPLLAWLREAEVPGVPAFPGVGGYRRGFAMPFGMLKVDGNYNSFGYAVPTNAPGLTLGMLQAPQSLWRTYDTWCSAYTKPTQVGVVSVAPPYIIPVRGIQIKIRFADPETRLTREITIVQEL